MSSNDPFTSDDTRTDESKYEEEQRLLSLGINPKELSPEERRELADDLDDDSRSSRLYGTSHDDGEDLSDVVPGPEVDGND